MHYEHHPDDERPLKADPQLLRRMLAYAAPYRGALLWALVLTMATTALQLAQPYVLKIAIDDYILGPGSAAGLRDLALLFGLIYSAGLFLHYWQFNLLMGTGQRIVHAIRRDLFAHLQDLPLTYMDRNPAGRLLTRVTNDAETLNELYTGFLVDLLRDLFLLAGIIVIMLRLHTSLALLTFSFIPLVLFATLIYRLKARPAFRELRRHLARLNSFAAENIAGIRIIQAFLQEKNRFNLFSAINEAYYRAGLRELKVFAVFRPAMDLFRSLALATLLWFGSGSVMAGLLPFGVLFAFINYVEQFFRPLNDISERYSILQAALASAERIFQLLDEQKEADPPAAVSLPLNKIRGHLVFDRVWFAYQQEDWVLKDLSLEIKAGARVAITGPTGAGKTSLVNLLNRFYPVNRGSIRLDGTDINLFDRRALRQQIGTVQQEVFLFNATVRENITLNLLNLSPAELEVVARAAGSYAFIRELPEKFDTPVGERGFTLSTGQRQLLALTRILVFNPSIFILDEATAHLDAYTEALLQHSLARAMEGRTSIMIAHRLSTLKMAEQIFYLDQGRIKELNNFQQLLAELQL